MTLVAIDPWHFLVWPWLFEVMAGQAVLGTQLGNKSGMNWHHILLVELWSCGVATIAKLLGPGKISCFVSRTLLKRPLHRHNPDKVLILLENVHNVTR